MDPAHVVCRRLSFLFQIKISAPRVEQSNECSDMMVSKKIWEDNDQTDTKHTHKKNIFSSMCAIKSNWILCIHKINDIFGFSGGYDRPKPTH